MNNDLKQICKCAQNGSEEAMLYVVKKFNPIIAKYAFMLNYEDNKADMMIFIRNLINKMQMEKFQGEGQIVGYIVKSIKNEYMRLSLLKSKKAQNEFLVDGLFDKQEPVCEADPMEETDLKMLMINLLAQRLTVKERTVLFKHFVEDKLISQIAMEEGISRQAVNQIKNVALQKL